MKTRSTTFLFQRSHSRTIQLLAIWLLILISGTLQGAQVSEEVSREAAQRFLSRTSTHIFGTLRVEQLQLVYTVEDHAFENAPAVIYFRVFNADDRGFVIIAGDDIVLPVLGYSVEGPFASSDMPLNVTKWFEGYKVEIRRALQERSEASEEAAMAWQRLMDPTVRSEGGSRAVNPLVQTAWDQVPHVNALCPGGSVSGCVATAMAQIMKYHNHPANGVGFHSYSAPNYGTQSANFAGTTYNWGAMPNVVSSPNSAVATLMYHCGVSVDMQYSPQVSNAYVLSNASPIQNCSEYAMKTYFGYSPNMQGVHRDSYSEAQWINLLKGDLDASRPILYAGFGSGGGHAFICDGYDNNNFFHFNWGWGGQADGYFMVGSLNPGSTGTGGGTGGYNSGQQALIGIVPVGGGGGGGGTPPNDMGLYNFVSPSSSLIYYGEPFSVSTNIVNNGTNAFSGDYAAAVFDNDDNFYGFIEILTGYTLPAGFVYNNDLVFSTAGLFSMLPGTYRVGIFHRSSGGEWALVANNGSYTNLPLMTVINPNDIELNSAMVVTPGTTVTQGGPISVNLNVVNDGFNTFVGQYGLALYNLDGSWAQDVGMVNEPNGLPSGYTYLSPFITFGPVNVTIPPGTYLLAAQHNPNNSGWQLTGSSYFTNPVMVNVVAAGESPDQYEPNNTVAQAYTLPVNFSGNTASTATTGSTLHNGTDQDHYKVVLAPGYNYIIAARLHDSYNSGNGNTYTVDGLFSWSGDGNSWSPIYDDVMPDDILVTDGGTIHFHVAPYFAGELGTYLLELDIIRGGSVGIGENELVASIPIYPNPARDRLTIDLQGFDGHVERYQLYNLQGGLVQLPGSDLLTGEISHLDLGTIAEGAYLIQLITDKGIRTERIIIAR